MQTTAADPAGRIDFSDKGTIVTVAPATRVALRDNRVAIRAKGTSGRRRPHAFAISALPVLQPTKAA